MKVTLVGNLVEDVTADNTKTVKTEKGESQVTTLSVAEAGKEKQYHTVKYWGREKLAQYLKKGTTVMIEGDLSYSLAEKEDRSQKYYSITANEVVLLTKKKED